MPLRCAIVDSLPVIDPEPLSQGMIAPSDRYAWSDMGRV